jgi:hypothetical protein
MRHQVGDPFTFGHDRSMKNWQRKLKADK